MKKLVLLLTLTAMIFTLSACSGDSSTETETTSETVIVTDRAGNEVEIPTNPENVVVAGASIVEIMSGLGVTNQIIAVDNFSTDVEGLSEDIATFDAMNPDMETIISLNPDLVLVNTYATPTSSDVYKSLTDAGIPVVFVPVSDSFEDIYKDIEFIADVMNVSDVGAEMVGQMQSDIEALSAIAATIPEEEKKTVYFENNPAPSMYSCGSETFVNEMLETIGAENVMADQAGWIPVSEEVVVEKNPDVIITNVNFIPDPVTEITSRPGWDSISAVQNGEVYYVDTNSTSRPTQNIVKGMEEMAMLIYPEYFTE